MAAESEMTIVIRAVDATRGVLSSIRDQIGRGLVGALRFATREVLGFLKSMFGLRAILLGGGVFALLASGVRNLAKSAREFQPVFGAEGQRRIDNVAESLSKLKATLLGTLGSIVARYSTQITSFIDGIGEWVARVAPKFVDWLIEFAVGLRDIANQVGQLAKNLQYLGDTAKDLWRIFSAPLPALFSRGISEAARRAAGLPDAPAPGSSVPDDEIERFKDYVAAARAAADANKKLGDSYKFVIQEVKKFLVDLETVADLLARTTTDALISLIENVGSFVENLKTLVASLLKDLARLFIQAAILRIISQQFGINVGADVGVLGTANPAPRQMGGRVLAGQPYIVGERRPELFIPDRNGRIAPNVGAGGLGQTVIHQNFYGPTNPKAVQEATAQAMLGVMERHLGFRMKVRRA